MKIIQINAVYGVGSTGHIVQDIHEMLYAKGHESYIFWATACANADNLRISIELVPNWTTKYMQP